MILFDFDYERPGTLEEAAALLARLGADARALAGGTDLLPAMRMEKAKPAVLVSLSAIEPTPPEELSDGTIRIDALSRLASLESSGLLKSKAPMLAEAAHSVGGNQIRQMGTLGGNLCQETRCLYIDQRHDWQFVAPCYKRGGDCCYPFPRNRRNTCWSVYMSDIAPALIALDATIEILGADGMRRAGAGELFTGDGLNPLSLKPSELLRAVLVPPARPGCGWGYHKSTVRGGLEFGMAIVAVVVQLAQDGRTCTDARVVCGAVREGPVRSPSAESRLAGAVLDEERIAQAAAQASKEFNPLPHHGFTKRYLMDNISVHLRRTLALAIERARRKDG